eukprot:m.221308 g.221308  ORF g.221308 m.221308 type:complete len:60 (-) comp54163_c0_seq17:89-268(-)
MIPCTKLFRFALDPQAQSEVVQDADAFVREETVQEHQEKAAPIPVMNLGLSDLDFEISE